MPRPSSGAMEKTASLSRRKPIRTGTPTRANTNREAFKGEKSGGNTEATGISFPKKRARQDDGSGALKLTDGSSQPAKRSKKQQRKQQKKAKRAKTNSGDAAPNDNDDDDDDDAAADGESDGAESEDDAAADANGNGDSDAGKSDDDGDEAAADESVTWQGEDLAGRVPEHKKPAPRPVQGIDIPINTAVAAAPAAASVADAGAVGVLNDVEAAELRRTLAITTVMTPATLPLPPVINSFASPLLPPVFGQYMTGRSGGAAGRFTAPSAIQCQAWPAILMGYDVIAQAGTGSGKTLTYLLPAITHIHKNQTPNDTKLRLPIALALLPTRELAVQVLGIAKHFEKPFRIQSVGLYGGARRDDQWDVVTSRHVQLVVATPGRLLDFVKAKQVSLRRVSYVVLDEADRMLSMGFVKELNAIVAATAPVAERQIICLSATYPHSVEQALAHWVTHAKPSARIVIGAPVLAPGAIAAAAAAAPNPLAASSLTLTGALASAATGATSAAAASATAALNPNNPNGLLMVSPSISQIVQCCAAHKKPRKLLKFLSELKQREDRDRIRHRTSVLVFVNKIKTVRELELLIKKHQNDVYTAQGLHSQKTQSERDRVMRDFKNGKIPILIATDVAGRGIDMKQLRVIINYDFPSTLQQYVHRCGRTARAPISTADKPASAAATPAAGDAKGKSTPAPPPGIPIVPEWGSGRGLAFSFFTRNRALLAADLIAILRANAQYVDPNLTALADEVARELPTTFGVAATAGGAPTNGGAAGASAAVADDDADGDDEAEDTWKKPTAASAAPVKPVAAVAKPPAQVPTGAAPGKVVPPAKPAATASAAPAVTKAKVAPVTAGKGEDDSDADEDDDEDDEAVGAWTKQSRAIPGSSIVMPPTDPNRVDTDSDADADDDAAAAPPPPPPPKKPAAAAAKTPLKGTPAYPLPSANGKPSAGKPTPKPAARPGAGAGAPKPKKR